MLQMSAFFRKLVSTAIIHQNKKVLHQQKAVVQ